QVEATVGQVLAPAYGEQRELVRLDSNRLRLGEGPLGRRRIAEQGVRARGRQQGRAAGRPVHAARQGRLGELDSGGVVAHAVGTARRPDQLGGVGRRRGRSGECQTYGEQ